MPDETGRTLIAAGIAFGIVFFLVLIGVATGGMITTSNAQAINQTIMSNLLDSARNFLSSYGGIIGIVLLVAVVLGKLGIGKIIESAFS